ncbi:WXG100 family type VII secretion target [Streptomyces sp. NPDC002573]|uniref:WXG100 family type VII secretion target n=1 Tax=Streptomyces sp. NPDC002573 TaxID=3364651 RepID=UPI0036874C82
MGASGDISIHPDEITAQAPTFAAGSDDLTNALRQLQSSLDGLGTPWGSDKQGAQFGAAYSPQRDAVLKALGILVAGLNSIHEGLTTHAANHTETDAHNAAILNHLR